MIHDHLFAAVFGDIRYAREAKLGLVAPVQQGFVCAPRRQAQLRQFPSSAPSPQKVASSCIAHCHAPSSPAKLSFTDTMSFPGAPGTMPGMNPNAGMSEQEQQMVKLVRSAMLQAPAQRIADHDHRCKQEWRAASERRPWRA